MDYGLIRHREQANHHMVAKTNERPILVTGLLKPESVPIGGPRRSKPKAGHVIASGPH